MIRCIMLASLLLTPFGAAAEAPDVQTPAPVIHLADNLDEADRLGWCIDTQGRGFGKFLHAHSCKPRGGDVQFSIEPATGLIRSVAFPDYCMIYAPETASPMGLVTCDADDPRQVFTHRETGEITRDADPSRCLAVGATSAAAGPFMSRSLDMLPCASVPAALKIWEIIT